MPVARALRPVSDPYYDTEYLPPFRGSERWNSISLFCNPMGRGFVFNPGSRYKTIADTNMSAGGMIPTGNVVRFELRKVLVLPEYGTSEQDFAILVNAVTIHLRVGERPVLEAPLSLGAWDTSRGRARVVESGARVQESMPIPAVRRLVAIDRATSPPEGQHNPKAQEEYLDAAAGRFCRFGAFNAERIEPLEVIDLQLRSNPNLDFQPSRPLKVMVALSGIRYVRVQ